MTLEEQIALVHRVMMDRTITARPGPRRKALQALGLPDDANVNYLMSIWRRRRESELYKTR
jgi:hypothetical protein